MTLSVDNLVAYPPEGYRFISASSLEESVIQGASRFDWAYGVQHWLGTRVPLPLVKSYLGRFKSTSSSVDLTYALMHLVLRKEPWVLDMQCEPPHLLLWIRWSDKQRDRFRDSVRKRLASPYCRKVICWVEAGKKAFLSWLGSDLEDKIEMVYWGVPRRNFVKNHNDGKTKLLFVNSGNINTMAHFNRKGGSEVLQAFLELNRRYDNLELVIRSGIPKGVRRQYEGAHNVRILDRPVPWEELEEEWRSADIFVLPSRATPAQAFLDAMSYELPIVTTDVWGNPELVEDGKTGLLVHYPKASRYIHDWVPYYHSRYEDTFKEPDADLVRGLVAKLSLLIERPELRRRMGQAARREVEKGRFSLHKRNQALKRVLDEATA